MVVEGMQALVEGTHRTAGEDTAVAADNLGADSLAVVEGRN
jgi:hypothetical protein